MAVWIGDALSGVTLDLWGRAIQWRMKRQASQRSHVMALVDLALLTLVAVVVVGVL